VEKIGKNEINLLDFTAGIRKTNWNPNVSIRIIELWR